jgi:pentatricopeptide repeat protein
MNENEPKVITEEHATPSLWADFERAVDQARDLCRQKDYDTALELLRTLEERYTGSVTLFDLIGDILLARGDVEEGIRYKTLYEVLRGTFRILDTESRRSAPIAAQSVPIPRDTPQPREAVGIPTMKPCVPEVEREAGDAVALPVTISMGNECMRQGHFDRAYDIFSKLIESGCVDNTVREAREKARKKKNEKDVLGVLNNWLENLNKLKSVG